MAITADDVSLEDIIPISLDFAVVEGNQHLYILPLIKYISSKCIFFKQCKCVCTGKKKKQEMKVCFPKYPNAFLMLNPF